MECFSEESVSGNHTGCSGRLRNHGGGIVQTAARFGFATVGIETSTAAATAAQERIEAGLRATADRGKITQDELAQALARITITTDFAAVADADLVIEAVFEDVDLKKKVLADIDALVAPGAYIASNTSTIPW